MIDVISVFSKEKLDINTLILDLELNKDEVLTIDDDSDWINKNKETLVIKYNGYLDEEDDDQYVGYHYYDIFYEKEEYLNKFKNLKDIIIE